MPSRRCTVRLLGYHLGQNDVSVMVFAVIAQQSQWVFKPLFLGGMAQEVGITGSALVGRQSDHVRQRGTPSGFDALSLALRRSCCDRC